MSSVILKQQVLIQLYMTSLKIKADHAYCGTSRIFIDTLNDKKLMGLKFGKSANNSVLRKKVWQIHPELCECSYGY